MQITACPFDGNRKLRAVGVKDASALECPHCKQVFVIQSRENGTFHDWKILVYSSVMRAAAECPIEFQESLF